MKVLLPKQHGAWAMLIIPYWLCVIAAGFHWVQIPFFIGWLFVYLTTYPLLTLIKTKKTKNLLKWVYIYSGIAIVFIVVPFIYQPKIIMFSILLIPLFAINIYFASSNNERSLLNDISAIIVFSIAGLIAGYLAEGFVSEQVWVVALLSFLFFLGSTFYVKTMIREKKNTTYKWISWIYNGMLVVYSLLLGEFILAAAFLFSAVRSVAFYGKKITIKKVGVYEILNSLWFSVFVIIYILN